MPNWFYFAIVVACQSGVRGTFEMRFDGLGALTVFAQALGQFALDLVANLTREAGVNRFR